MKTPEEFLQTYAPFEFDAWKKDHSDQLRILSKAMKDYAETCRRGTAKHNGKTSQYEKC